MKFTKEQLKAMRHAKGGSIIQEGGLITFTLDIPVKNDLFQNKTTTYCFEVETHSQDIIRFVDLFGRTFNTLGTILKESDLWFLVPFKNGGSSSYSRECGIEIDTVTMKVVRGKQGFELLLVKQVVSDNNTRLIE